MTHASAASRGEEVTTSVALWLVLPVTLLVFVWALLSGLDLGFWHDEIWTMVRFVNPGPIAVFNGPYVPNNHMLFSLLAWASTSLGGQTEIVARFWSVVPTLGLVAIGAPWIARRLGWAVTISFVVLVAANPLVIVVARQARGYGLAMLCTALMIGATWESLAPDTPPSRLVSVAIFGALAIFTLPITVLAFLSLASLLYVRYRRHAVITVGAVGAASVIWYWGNLPELLDSVDQRFGEPHPWYGFFSGPFETLMFPVARLLRTEYIDPFRPPADSLSAWTVSALLVLGGLSVLGALRLKRQASSLQSLAVWVPVAATFAVLTVSRLWMLDRFVSFLIAPVTLLVAAGIVEASRLVARTSEARTAAWVAASVGALFLLSLALPTYERLTTTPVEGFKEVAEIISSRSEPILTNSLASFGLDYYLDRDFEILNNNELEAIMCAGASDDRIFINHPQRQSELLDTGCLVDAGYQVTRVDQLIRGDWIDVWVPDDD